jgi:hypothetical protein
MTALREEKARAERRFGQLTLPDLDAGHSALAALQDLLGNAQRLYRVAAHPDEPRRRGASNA